MIKPSTSVRQIILVVLGIFIFAASAGGGYYAGFLRGANKTESIVVEGAANLSSKTEAVNFTEFWSTWSLLKSKYVSKDIVGDNTRLLYGAIDGLIRSLDDPYTVFLPPRDAKSFIDEIAGAFGGIGAEIGYNENKEVVIIAPLKNTPAERAGLQPKDRILRVDDVDTTGLTPEEVAQRIRGERGTSVMLTITRNGEKVPAQIRVVRDIITIPTLDFKMVNALGEEDDSGTIAYIKLYNFYEKAPAQFQQAAVKSILLGAKGIVFDLRNNPGGYLQAAHYIAGWFLPKGEPIVTEAFQDESQNQNLLSEGPAVLQDKPVVILMNKGSASASEIVAGALQDNKRAIIMGEKSFGKGTVQELLPLGKDGAMVKITIAHWLTPNGNIIDKNGIIPDVELTISTSTNENAVDPWVVEAARKISD